MNGGDAHTVSVSHSTTDARFGLLVITSTVYPHMRDNVFAKAFLDADIGSVSSIRMSFRCNAANSVFVGDRLHRSNSANGQ